MSTNRSLPRTPLALGLLSLLLERPMHPYEMKGLMQERGHDRVIKIKGASVYDAVERLSRLGFIEPLETSREGRRPERTVYSLTEAGRDELLVWLRELISRPVSEYPQFGAALAFMAGLGNEKEVIALLQWRVVQLEAEIAAGEKVLNGTLEQGIPRMFVIEEEYALAMRRAEVDFVRHLIDDLEAGGLWPDAATLEALVAQQRERGGGTV
ncbi:MAG: PadR family transcriptional regulator [Candidatus Dormibacteraeota bacterium]|nr:PadR family transcriptional regulator [Candidatus Dormibacteraeota bacterium]